MKAPDKYRGFLFNFFRASLNKNNMPNNYISRGTKLYIRKEKSRIRKEVSSPQEREKLVKELKQKFFKNERKKKA